MMIKHAATMTAFVLLVACGDGDGTAGSGTHPALATCTAYRSGSETSCTEYRNIGDADWAGISQTCSGEGISSSDVLTEDATCSRQSIRGACRTTESSGMTTTKWYYSCAVASEPDCELQPSKIQGDCQGAGGTYLPPDAAGLR